MTKEGERRGVDEEWPLYIISSLTSAAAATWQNYGKALALYCLAVHSQDAAIYWAL